MKVSANKLVIQNAITHRTTKANKAFATTSAREVKTKQDGTEVAAAFFDLTWWDGVENTAQLQPGSVIQLLDGDLDVNVKTNQQTGQKTKYINISVKQFNLVGHEPQHVFQKNGAQVPQQAAPAQPYQAPAQTYQAPAPAAPSIPTPAPAASPASAPQYQSPAPQMVNGYQAAPVQSGYPTPTYNA
jgi:hypothetical protein